MQYYRFTSRDGRSRALTVDRSGSTLPRSEENWSRLGPMLLDEGAPRRIGVSADEVAAHIARDGYFILPPPPPAVRTAADEASHP